MRVIYIEHYAGSDEYGMEFRPYYFARNWVKEGLEVYIIAASYSHLRKKNPKVSRDFQTETIDGIHYLWIKTTCYKGNGVERVVNVEQFIQKLDRHAKTLAKELRPDVVIASSTYPMDTYPAQKICKFSGAVLIHEVHDMWPITPMELYGLKPSNPIIKYLQKAENSFCVHSDKIVSLAPCSENYYIEHGMQKGKFEHIPNGIVKSDWPDNPTINIEIKNAIDSIHQRFSKVICFFGSHTKSYALDYLIRAASKCRDLSIAYLFVGNGTCKNELIELAKELNLNSVFFMDPISKKDIPGLLSLVDCIYIGALHNRMFKYGICMNKLFDSLASGKPIIFAADVPNDYIKKYGCGFSVAAESVEALVEGIRKFDNCNKMELQEMGFRGRTACIENFEYEKLSKDFITIMKNAIIEKEERNKS